MNGDIFDIVSFKSIVGVAAVTLVGGWTLLWSSKVRTLSRKRANKRRACRRKIDELQERLARDGTVSCMHWA